jgi:ribosome-associated protein
MSSSTPPGPATTPGSTTLPGPVTSPDPVTVPQAAMRAAEVADAKQGSRTAVLAMGGLLGVTDAFVITSARNSRLVRTIVEEIEARLKQSEARAPLRVEGLGDLQWVLMDYGDLVVHVFLDETREVYDLERLWGDAPRVPWQPAVTPTRA